MTPSSLDFGGTNPISPELFAHGDPHPFWKLLRERDPVHWHEDGVGPGFWMLTKYEDVMSVYRDHTRFSSERGMNLSSRVRPDPAGGRMLVVTDPPRHGELRRVMKESFTPREIRLLEDRVRREVRERVDRILKTEAFDFVSEVAAPIALAIICEIMGIPKEDREYLFNLTTTSFGAEDPDYRRGSERRTAERAHFEIFMYFARQLEVADHQGAGFIGRLASTDVSGTRLEREDVLLNCLNLLLGGNETTRHAMTGGVLALLNTPQELSFLSENPDLIPRGVEEVLRWTTPAAHVLRTCSKEMSIKGTVIRKGELVSLWNSSANRDEEHFENPFDFRVSRDPNDHLAFGAGIHFCLGARLARMELRILLEELVPNLKRLKQAGELERLGSNFLQGIKRLPLMWTRKNA